MVTVAQLIYECNKDLFDRNALRKIAAIDNDLDRSMAFDRYFGVIYDDLPGEVHDHGQTMTQAIDEARATIREALQRLAPVMIEDVRQGRQDWDELRTMLEDHPEVRDEVENYL